jgi:hypothetical protein
MSARSIRRANRRARERESGSNRLRRLASGWAVGGALLIAGSAVTAPKAEAASIEVTNTDPSGPGSLYQAVIDADADAVSDTITFAADVTGEIRPTYPLQIDTAVQIEGPGSDVLSVVGNGSRVFEVGGINGDDDREVTISGLTIAGGTYSQGAGITNDLFSKYAAELTVDNCVVTGNVASGGNGGGIYNGGGSLTILDSTISDNHSTGALGYGGGVAVDSTEGDQPIEVTISDSTLTGNTATHDGGAAYIHGEQGDVLIEGSTISANEAEDGGGILFGDPGQAGIGVEIESSTFSDNTSAGLGGAMWLNRQRGPVGITSSTLSGNSAVYGGGIDETSYYSQPLTITGSTIAHNSASGNGGGIYRLGYDAGTTATLRNTIVAANTSSGTGPDTGLDLVQSGAGGFNLSHSLIGTTTGAGTFTQSPSGSNRLNVAPQLGPLADNGGPTETMLPSAMSPAIDAGIAAGLTTDQRGLARTVDQPSTADFAGSDGTDIGAVERQDDTLEGAHIKAKKKQRQKGKKIVVKVKAGAAEDVTAEASGKVKLGKKKLKLRAATKQADAGKTATLKLKPKGKKSSKTIAKALDQGKKAKAVLSVTLTDAAGNSATKQPKVKLK